MLLTYKYREAIVNTPATKAVNRRDLNKHVDDEEPNTFGANLNATFELRRSGRKIRRVEGAPPIHLRNWKAPNGHELFDVPASGIGKQITLAETVYIFKPLLHLGGVATFGLNSWKSYGLALMLDAYRFA